MNDEHRANNKGRETHELVKAFQSALAGETGPERCIELLKTDAIMTLDLKQTFNDMTREAAKHCIPGDNVKDGVLHAEALCQTAVLMSMCSTPKLKSQEELVKEIVAYHQRRSNIGNHQQSNKDEGDAEYWWERAEYHISHSKSKGRMSVRKA